MTENQELSPDLYKALSSAKDIHQFFDICGKHSLTMDPYLLSLAFHFLSTKFTGILADSETLSRYSPLIQRLISQAVEKVSGFYPSSIAAITWSLASLHLMEEARPLFSKFSEHLTKQAPQKIAEFNPREIVNILWAYASLNQPDCAPLFQLFALKITTNEETKNFTSQEITTLMWSYAILGQANTAKEIFSNFVKILQSQNKQKIKLLTSQEIATIFWSFASLGYANEATDIFIPLIMELRHQDDLKLRLLTAQDQDNIAWAIMSMGLEPTIDQSFPGFLDLMTSKPDIVVYKM